MIERRKKDAPRAARAQKTQRDLIGRPRSWGGTSLLVRRYYPHRNKKKGDFEEEIGVILSNDLSTVWVQDIPYRYRTVADLVDDGWETRESDQ